MFSHKNRWLWRLWVLCGLVLRRKCSNVVARLRLGNLIGKEALMMRAISLIVVLALTTGVFAAISYNDGKSWPHIRLISDDKPDRQGETRNGKKCTIGFTSSEPQGYMSACEGTNGIIHVVSSWNEYALNLKWLETLPPAKPVN